MCRWIAYRGEPVFLEEYVVSPRRSLVVQSRRAAESMTEVNGDGFGLGWYGERAQPGVFRDVRPAWSDDNLLSVAHQIRSNLFLAHVRASTGTSTTRANCHPFAVRQWLFMHNGQIGDYWRLRRQIEMAIPDHLFEHRSGTTDSEALFLVMMGSGLDDDPLLAAARAVGRIEAMMRESNVEAPLRFTSAFSDGENLYAVRYSSDGQPLSLYTRRRASGNGVLVASEPLDEVRDGWDAVPSQSFVTVGACGVTVEPFSPVVG
jgi:glutamine amidotransferase